MARSITINAAPSVIEILEVFAEHIVGDFEEMLSKSNAVMHRKITDANGQTLELTVSHMMWQRQQVPEVWTKLETSALVLTDEEIQVACPHSLAAALLSEVTPPQTVLARLCQLPAGITPKIHCWISEEADWTEHVLVGRYRASYKKVVTHEYLIKR